MKQINISLAVLAVLTAIGLTLISAPQLSNAKTTPAEPSASATTLVGTVSCAGCRGTCPKKAETLYSCTLRNVHSGSPYVLVVGDHEYMLSGNLAGLEKFAGGKAAVHGQLEDSSMIVESVADAKSPKAASLSK